MPCANVRKSFALAIAFVCVCLCAVLASPSQAYAWLDDVTDSYPASQAIPISGDVLTGADVPEGNYSVEAETSSYMCKMTNATLTSAGGELWVTFTLSKAYNALYFGTAEEAASLSEEEGEDYSPYITVDPIEGYVARQFSIPIPALNYEFTLSVFSGGNKGTDKGLWYTRTVVVHSSSEIDEAVAGGGGEDEPSGGDDSGTDPSGGDDSGSQEVDPGGTDEQASEEEPAAEEPVADDSEPEEDDEPDKSKSSDEEPDKSPIVTSSGNNSGNTQNEESNTPEEEKSASSKAAASKAAAKKAAKGAKIGRSIRFVSPDEVILQKEPPDIEAQKVEAEQKQSSMTAMALVFTLINTALAGAFVVGLRNSKPRSRGLTR